MSIETVTESVRGPGEPASGEPVLLLCAHGSTARSAQVATEEIAAAVSTALPDTDVVLTWVDVQEPNVEARCSEYADRPVVIVPLLLSAGFHVHQDLAQAVAERPHHVVTRALGPDRGLSELMARRIEQAEATASELEAASRDADREQLRPTLVLIAAGSSDERAVRDVHRQAEDLAELTARDVRVGFVSAVEPTAHQAVADAWHDGAHHVTAVSFHVARGCSTVMQLRPLRRRPTGRRRPTPVTADGSPSLCWWMARRYPPSWWTSSSSGGSKAAHP